MGAAGADAQGTGTGTGGRGGAAGPARGTTRRHLLLGAAALAALPGGAGGAAATGPDRPDRPDRHDAGPAAAWLRTLYAVVAAEGMTPPAAARFYAYCTVGMYEAVVPTECRLRSLGGQLRALDRLPSPRHRVPLDATAALAAAALEVATGVRTPVAATTPQLLRARFDADLAARRAAGVREAVLEASVLHGRAVGHHVAAWAATDGAAGAAQLPYAPPVGEGLWEPTPPNFGTAIEPHCAQVRTMVLRRADEVVPAPPVAFSAVAGSAFHDQAMAVVRQSLDNTDETRDIARFWTDNPSFSGMPSGHWLHIAVQVAEQHGHDLGRTVEALARTGVVLHDAFVNCWTWKYRHQLLRPVTYVRRYVDPAWTTWVNTPQFPEHTSGHSVGSAAAAVVLGDALGRVPFDDTALATTVGIVRRTRHYQDVGEAARTAARSRLYGGIHYPWGIEAGLAQGQRIGALAVRRLRTRR